MSEVVVWTRKAEKELEDIVYYIGYEANQPEIAIKLYDQFLKRVDRIATHRQSGSITHSHPRICVTFNSNAG